MSTKEELGTEKDALTELVYATGLCVIKDSMQLRQSVAVSPFSLFSIERSLAEIFDLGTFAKEQKVEPVIETPRCEFKSTNAVFLGLL